jgi:non-ribosomal peptide synthetase component F
VRQRSLAAYEHQDVPFEVLVERLNPTRSLTHHPLIQVMLAWQNFAGHDAGPAAGLTLGDVDVTPIPVDTQTARMDLTFSLGERWDERGEPAGIGGTVEFRTDVFDEDSIRALVDRLQRVLLAMTADPTQALSAIDLLDDTEHARLAAFGNRAALSVSAPRTDSIPALFAAQAARTPDAVALVCDGRSLTYRELDEASNRLAPARDGLWHCCFRARPRPSCRSWRCSSPGRPTCRSTRRCPRRGSDSCSTTPRRSPRSPPPT